MLERLIPTPRRIEFDHVELAAPAEQVWQRLRHENLARSPLIRALFAVRTLPSRSLDVEADREIRIDQLRSSPEHPGFQMLYEDPPRELVVGAIGKVWHLDIPFVHVSSAEEFRDFREPDFVKVAWALRVVPRGEHCCRVEVEIYVEATDDEAWRKFRRYFRLIGPGSQFIRHSLLSALAHDYGTPETTENQRALPGDELLPDAVAQSTHGVTIHAPPERIWPWLVQMGGGRAGFYSHDALDNGRERSARELHQEWQRLSVGQVLSATPDGEDGFEVLRVDAPHTLIFGGLFDVDRGRQLPFSCERPEHFWQSTWTFVLEPLDATTTRLHARVRGKFSSNQWLRALWIRPVHALMQRSQLEHLRKRAEGRLPKDDVWDVLDGMGGAGRILAALATPFWRTERQHWGLEAEVAARQLPGDELVPEPRWSWTHGVEIEAPAASVWPWLAQIGADRAGFYSYQWLENLAGCEIQNAETIHSDWEARVGDPLLLHSDPQAPRLTFVSIERGRFLVAHAAADETAKRQGKPWTSASWLFFLEPLDATRCRLISRFRSACSDDLATRLGFGPTLVEPVGFAMDRRFLLGVKERAERR
jgi:hypothetical protein